MDPTQVASATSFLTALGLGKYAAGIVSLVALVMAVAQQTMPYLPVPDVTTSRWYAVPYGIFAHILANRGNNAPVPASAAVVAPAMLASAPVPAPAADMISGIKT